MSYLVFARKWRPQTFEEVVGQRHVTQTLMNALSTDRVAHAYLFAGPRGVGKTTTARILAKALNCERGISREPCNACPSCQDIGQGRHLDVIEVDGASNRGIDEIRELRENVKFTPYRGRYKVIVIDEVHMLTEPAFNALLKTLEEPPSRVVFMLATTESHKVPLTILSRCQRFEFRRIATAEIKERLEEMARAESIEIDPAGLQMIAEGAEGSLRDAQSLLDQVTSFSGPRVRAEDVMTVLGVGDRQQVAKAVEWILDGEGKALLQLLEDLHSAGHDLRLFGLNLLEWMRDLMIYRTRVSEGQGGLTGDALREKADQLSFPELDRMLQILMQAEMEMRRSPYPRFVLEMALLRIVEGRRLASIEELWNRLNQMEEKLTPGRGVRVREPLPRGPAERSSMKASPTAEIGRVQEASVQAGADRQGSSVNWLKDPRWAEFKRIIKREKVSLAPLLEYFSSVSPQGATVMVRIEGANSYLSEVLEDQHNRRILEGGVRAAFGEDLRVRYEFGKKEPGEVARGDRPPAPSPPPSPGPPPDSLVEKALQVFEGRVVKQ
jgi:DNA polymerase-3 subunit gamma/tau